VGGGGVKAVKVAAELLGEGSNRTPWWWVVVV